jgi:hypothetical protein
MGKSINYDPVVPFRRNIVGERQGEKMCEFAPIVVVGGVEIPVPESLLVSDVMQIKLLMSARFIPLQVFRRMLDDPEQTVTVAFNFWTRGTGMNKYTGTYDRKKEKWVIH